jgi:hypothetical protein
MTYTDKIFQMDQNDHRIMARYIGHMLLMATEYMEGYHITNMMMNQLNPFFVAQSLDSAGVEYFDIPPFIEK